MIIEENRPEPNEGKVTYTYDHLDRLLYRNVYQGDVPHLRATGGRGRLAGQRKPKKLLYQDYYTYNNNGLRSVTRIYQPIVEILPAVVGPNEEYILKANIFCKSPVIASGFIWIQTNDANEAKVKLMYKSMYTTNALVFGGDLGDNVSGARFLGSNTIGPIEYTISNNHYYAKAWAQIETGTLFSKTIYLPEI